MSLTTIILYEWTSTEHDTDSFLEFLISPRQLVILRTSPGQKMLQWSFADVQEEAEEMVDNLLPDTRYRARLQTVNEFGASNWSEDYEFDTFGGFYNETLLIEI